MALKWLLISPRGLLGTENRCSQRRWARCVLHIGALLFPISLTHPTPLYVCVWGACLSNLLHSHLHQAHILGFWGKVGQDPLSSRQGHLYKLSVPSTLNSLKACDVHKLLYAQSLWQIVSGLIDAYQTERT